MIHPRIVLAPVAPLVREPRVSAEQVSQLVRGMSVTILKTQSDGNWNRVRAGDGYEGWIHSGYLSPSGVGQQYATAAISLGCLVQTREEEARLPFGAHIFAGEIVLDGQMVKTRDLAGRFPPGAAAIVTTAVEHFRGTPYQWGGVTPWGADCSGFVQSVLRMHSIGIPRDSADQARAGNKSDSTPASNTMGDLLFFSDREDRRITHVGLALGGSRMAHVALGRGGFAIEDFRDGGGVDDYTEQLASRFVASVRL